VSIISERLKVIKPSPTIAVTTKARELKAAGKNVIGLGAGEPDFDTRINIKDAAITAINNGETKYTAVDGTPELKAAIKQKFAKENNISYEANEISVGTGAKQVLYNTFMASLNEGDEVIIPAPYWVSYPDIILLSGGTPIIVECGLKQNFKITPKQLEDNITSKTKWLILNSPSNPTGAAYTKDELTELANILKKHPNIYILSDDIYEHIVYDDFKFTTIAEIAPELKERTITLNGVSKAYSMTGWRIGFAGGNKDLIKAISIIQSQSTSNPSSISQAAAIEALNGPQEYIKENALMFQGRRDLVLNRLNDIPGLSTFKPQGAFYVFPYCADLFGKKTPKGEVIKNSTELAGYLLEDALVAVVPGSAFGTEGYFRISYATSNELLEQACERIKNSLAKLS